MKNEFKLFGIIVMVTVIIFGFISCDSNEDESYPQGTPDPDFYGRWRDNTSEWRQNTISANKLVYLHQDGSNYTMENLTWTAVNNNGANASTYPSGYSITGTLTTEYNVISSISGSELKKGDKHTRTIYINAAKNQIWILNSEGNPYNKQ
jgi:hypothetical protein